MDPTLSRESEMLLRELLKHQQKMRKEILIPYKILCEKAGVPFNRATIGDQLREVAEWCEKRGLPVINALVVQKSSGEPGPNYVNAPGGKRPWNHEVGECLTHKRYPSKP